MTKKTELIKARAVGMLRMSDESGVDCKILAVPVDKLSPNYRHVKGPDDLPSELLKSISHFFEHYKDLEEGKWVKIESWVGADEARDEINASVARFNG